MEAFPAQVIEVAPGQFVALPGPRFEPSSRLTRELLAGKVSTLAKIFATTF